MQIADLWGFLKSYLWCATFIKIKFFTLKTVIVIFVSYICLLMVKWKNFKPLPYWVSFGGLSCIIQSFMGLNKWLRASILRKKLVDYKNEGLLILLIFIPNWIFPKRRYYTYIKIETHEKILHCVLPPNILIQILFYIFIIKGKKQCKDLEFWNLVFMISQ